MSLAQLDQDVAKPRQAGFAPLIAALSGVLALLVAVSVELLWQRLGLGIFGIVLDQARVSPLGDGQVSP